MRLKSVTLRGLTTFTSPEPVHVDLDAISGGLVAVVGANGSGKTSLLSSVPAALYRTMPDRPGSLYDYCTGKDAFIEAAFDEGDCELKVRLLIDAENRKTEQLILRDGEPLTTGKAADNRELVAELFGSYELLLASVFASQSKAGDFLRMSKRDRKALLVELLGLAHLERHHEKAKAMRAEAELQLALCRDGVKKLEAELESLSEMEEERELARKTLDVAIEKVTRLKADELKVRDRLETAKRLAESLRRFEDALKSAERERTAAKERLIEAKRHESDVLARADKRRSSLEVRRRELDETASRKRHDEALERVATREAKLKGLLEREHEIQSAGMLVDNLLAEQEELRNADKRVVEANENWRVATGERDRCLDKLAAVREKRDALQRRAAMLDEVPCTDAPRWVPIEESPKWRGVSQAEPNRALSSQCPLLGDATAARETIASADTAVSEAEAAVARAEQAYSSARERHADASIACDPVRLSEISDELPEAQKLAALVDQLDDVRSELDGLADERRRIEVDYSDSVAADAQKRRALEEELAGIESERQSDAEEAARRASAATNAIEEANRRYSAAEAEHRRASASTGDVAAVERELRGVATELESAERIMREAEQSRMRLDAQVEALKPKASELESEREHLAGAELELGDWRLLEQALGPDGIQALEIDAAGPAVTETVNDLLESCYGPRFSVTFETQRELRSKAGTFQETFDVRVYDAGQERAAEALSGGERVVIGEAIGLALSIFNAQRSGVQWRTLFRDETSGALDPQNAEAYLAMLRHALELGGFDQVLFVSHQREIWERADVRLFVAERRVTSEGIDVDRKEPVTA